MVPLYQNHGIYLRGRRSTLRPRRRQMFGYIRYLERMKAGIRPDMGAHQSEQLRFSDNQRCTI